MNEDEKYLFDLNGYIVVKNVLDEEALARCNEAIDHYAGGIRERTQSLAGSSTALRGITGRGELSGMLGWEHPWREPFRDMLAHPRIVPYLHEILGKGFRLDHLPSLIGMRRGAEGHMLHGSSGPGFDPHQYYIFQDGRMHNGLTVVTWQLTDVNPGDGGLCLVPGSHKCNFALPLGLRSYEQHQEFVKQITCKAGDAVIFTEAVTHGTLPWQGEHQRRSILIRYSPGNLAYATHYVAWPEAFVDGMSKEQRAVMEPPYHIRLERPALDDTGKLE